MGVIPFRKLTLADEHVLVPLTKGHAAVIDAADAPLVSGRNWTARRSRHVWYALTNESAGGRKQKTVLMHRFLTGAAPGEVVDHVDGDGLNNRRSNLRVVGHAENAQNSRARKDNTSGVRGVCFHQRIGRWAASISAHGSRRHLGYFNTLDEAAQAYASAAAQLHGQFARQALSPTPAPKED